MKRDAQRKRPLIGVTTSEVREAERIQQTPQSDPKVREMVLGLTYLRALEAAGAVPMVMPPLPEEAIGSLLDRLDGVCLSGGPDLDPDTYGARKHPELGPTEPELDRFELAMARSADAREMPILAICRGTQALNVARRGSLIQHLPEASPDFAHRQSAPGDQTSHTIDIEPGSRLAVALGGDEVEVPDVLDVNSFHHQAIERLGEGLKITARAPDGTIEAIEDPGHPFLIGVQWHAETLVHRPYEAALFRNFVEACRLSPVAA